MSLADWIILSVMLVSGLAALMRGFSREVRALAVWVLALSATLIAVPQIAPMARKVIGVGLMTDFAVAGAIFLLALFLLSYVSRRIGDHLGRGEPGAIDRTLGFAFGLARGLVLLAIGFWFYSWTLEEGPLPAWAEESRLMPMVIGLAPALDKAVGLIDDEAASGRPQTGAEALDDARKTARPNPATPPPASQQTQSAPTAGDATPEEGTGYSSTDRRALDQLLTTTDQ